MLGISRLRHRYFYLLSSAYTPPRPCPRTIVISAPALGRSPLGSDTLGGEVVYRGEDEEAVF